MDEFFPEGSFFAAVAFTAEHRRGNPTGVVFAHPEWSDATCQRIAAELGFPDTAFVSPRPGGWTVRCFSPAQPLALCVQALIACGAVLSRRGDAVRLFPQTGEVEVRGEHGRFWASFPQERVRRGGEGLSLEMLSLPGSGTPGEVVESGRVRLFRALSSRAELDAISLSPPEVLGACARTGLQGLCFWTQLEGGAVALRAFTPSLDGGEDAATGGAVLGLSALLPEGTWRVEQGVGPFHRQGELWLRSGERLEVGGAVKVVASGMLAEL